MGNCAGIFQSCNGENTAGNVGGANQGAVKKIDRG